MLGGKREGVDAAKLTVWCILDELFDRVHRLRLRRLSQNSEEGFGFARKFHGIIGLITRSSYHVTGRAEHKSQISQPFPSANVGSFSSVSFRFKSYQSPRDEIALCMSTRSLLFS